VLGFEFAYGYEVVWIWELRSIVMDAEVYVPCIGVRIVFGVLHSQNAFLSSSERCFLFFLFEPFYGIHACSRRLGSANCPVIGS